MTRRDSLPFDLVETFVRLMDNGGDAGKTARELKILQPAMSKRLRYLQHSNPKVVSRPWLVREGKVWSVTEEGQRALPAARDLIRRYDQLCKSLEAPSVGTPDVKIACGRYAVLGFVREAVKRFCRRFPNVRLHMATLRGEARVDGVSNGSLDMATVAFNEAMIHQIARRELHVETISTKPLGLVCSKNTRWEKSLGRLPKTKLKPQFLADYPLILPEPDAGIRKILDGIFHRHDLLGKLNIRLEVGGWGTILRYVRDGLGVGLVNAAAVPNTRGLIVRYFDTELVPPSETKIISRYRLDSADLDLSDVAQQLYDMLCEAAAAYGS